MLPYLGQDQISVEVAEQASCLHHLIIYIIWSFVSLGAKDFSNAVSSFCQVLRVTRGSLARSLAEDLSRPSANNENSRCTREKPLIPRVVIRKQ